MGRMFGNLPKDKRLLYHSFDIKYGDIHGLIEFSCSHKFTFLNSGFCLKCKSRGPLGKKLEHMPLMYILLSISNALPLDQDSFSARSLHKA